MQTNKIALYFLIVLCHCQLSCARKNADSISQTDRAISTLSAVYSYYPVSGSDLLREMYPFDETYTATYLDNSEQASHPNPYSYLWPFSGSLSAVSALYEASKDAQYLEILQTKVLPGLEEYWDTTRIPAGYASYIRTAPTSDRFYDDNIWIGIDFTDLYLLTGEKNYLQKARSIWQFVESGSDDALGGGIYWCEQKKRGKNACSNAPAAVYALKLFEATNDSSFFYKGKKLYEWTEQHLKDTVDNLYYDNLKLNGKVDMKKYSYNSGQMIQAGALLYKITRHENYLLEAQQTALSCYHHFFRDFKPLEGGTSFRLVKKENVWFIAILFRGFCELYRVDNYKEYLDAFQKNMDYAWIHAREENGLFNSDWSGDSKDASKWLLTQTAMVEMYARLSIENE
ncbi:MAG: hypothetical protein EZS26_002131 [Candidatus Ordinivivax streblomastigis]|uniref:Alpha-1,6-mannanase n=1 Tax=Candidatus Ordinivivax streblomastigis TaxID=2540710 RepID=A0A5M8NZX1_9BACT|nr:MAG: hypothetical protein EZS26_002131 [Candidatus Ordinivivax streblomastigis]